MAIKLSKPKAAFSFLTLFYVMAKGKTEPGCIVKNGNYLTCTFKENINATRKDFTVYFYPDSGGEEPLLDCAWLHESLDCIQQEGFACKETVSENAIISVPTRFANRTGRYGCKTDTYVLTPCRYTESKEEGQYSTCQVHTMSEGCQLTVNCTFAVDADTFSIEINKSVVAAYSKTSCQGSDLCQHHAEDGKNIFTVKLKSLGCREGEYRCKSVRPTLELEGKVCTVPKDNPTESPPVAGVAVILPVVCTTATAAAAALLVSIIRRRRKAKLTKNEHDERAQAECLMSESDRGVRASTKMS